MCLVVVANALSFDTDPHGFQLKNEPITEQTAESLRAFFTTQCGPFLDPPTHAPEFLVILGELITYIVDIKLENAASVTPARDGRADQFTLWSNVLDRAIVSCLQVRVV